MNTPQELQASAALPLHEALRNATTLAETLRKMHRAGTVYGRLDPRNISWHDHAVQLAGNDAPVAEAYLSPEQVRGEATDARSDIFAFGAIAYEWLCGRRAFPAEDAQEVKTQILHSTPPVDGLPDGIATLLRRCLEKDRDLRWQSMSPVLIELKLANASARQSEWSDKVISLRSRLADREARLSAQRAEQESAAAELLASIRRIDANLAAIEESIAALQKNSQINESAIESLQVSVSQTDEVVEHVVEAFGIMHKSMLEVGDAKFVLEAGTGS
jgi:serine/threonine protein kinase